MTSMKPSVVLIPGSYCPALFYNDLKHLLLQAGYDVHLHDLPTTSRAPGLAPASLSDDGVYFHAIIKHLVSEGRDVVVVAHSYGGIVLRESIHNLSKQHRQKENKTGGISKLVYISPLLLDEDENGIQSFSRYADLLTFPSANFTEPVDPESEGGPQYLRQNPLKGWKFFFGDMDMEEGVKWMARMTMHTMSAWTTPATALPEDERRVPVTFVKCLQDVVFPPAFQEVMVKLLEGEGSKVDVKEIDSAHCPNASCPDELAKILVKAIEKRT